MTIPPEAKISEDKLTAYLLVRRQIDDKSGFLAQGGFSKANWPALQVELRQLVATNEAMADRMTIMALFFE